MEWELLLALLGAPIFSGLGNSPLVLKGDKKVESAIRNDLYAFFSEEKVNLDLIFDWQEDRGLLINVRARPWKNAPNESRMVLAAGRTVDEALLWAARGILNNRFIPLIWNRRCVATGIDKRLTITPNQDHVRRTPVLAQELFQEPDVTDNTENGTNGDYKAVQEQHEDNSQQSTPVQKRR